MSWVSIVNDDLQGSIAYLFIEFDTTFIFINKSSFGQAFGKETKPLAIIEDDFKRIMSLIVEQKQISI